MAFIVTSVSRSPPPQGFKLPKTKLTIPCDMVFNSQSAFRVLKSNYIAISMLGLFTKIINCFYVIPIYENTYKPPYQQGQCKSFHDSHPVRGLNPNIFVCLTRFGVIRFISTAGTFGIWQRYIPIPPFVSYSSKLESYPVSFVENT
jgi:hypothetical protein